MSKNPLLDKIAGARASGMSNIIRDGVYLFTVGKVILENKSSGNMFIAELFVDESKDVPDTWEKNGKACWQCEGATLVKANPVGSTPGYAVNLDTSKSAAGNAKSFVLTLCGADENETSADDFSATLADLITKENPGRGMQIRAQTSRKAIKTGDNAGKPFVGIKWTHVPMNADEIAARRAILDAAPAKAA